MLIGLHQGVDAMQITLLASIEVVLIAIELFILVMFLYNAYRTIESRFSAKRILAGPVAPAFWLGVVACGLIIPFFLELYGGHGMAASLAAIMGLFGGLCLRYTVLAGGSLSPIMASGFEFARVARPKDPMPAMGKVPPS
jgi:formate-dependent nitrite reductase membrane component NrfD